MKKLLLLPYFLLIGMYMYAQGWELIYPQNANVSGDLVKGIVPNGSNLLYAVGNDIFIYNDAGNFQNGVNTTTLPIQEQEAGRYFGMQFVSESKAYMFNKNNIYMSQNTGLVWTNQLSLDVINPSYTSSKYFLAMHFPTENTGYAVGPFKKIYKTQDGGATWKQISASPSTTPYIQYSGVYFLNESVGFVSGHEVNDILMNFGFQEFVMKTTNGGETWERYEISTLSDFQQLSLDFKTEQTGFVFCSVTQGIEQIFVTNDSAQTWTNITPENIGEISCICWIDSATGILYGVRNNMQILLKTVNQGQTWYEVPFPISHNLSKNTINDIVFVNSTNGYTVGKGGLVMFTDDAGESWQVLNEETIKLWQIDFVSENNAFGNTGFELYKTTDGGQTWDYLENASTHLYNYIFDIDFNNENEGYVLGYGSSYLKTNDGLQTFEMKALPVSFFYSYKYIELAGDTIYIAGTTSQTNELLISTDEGNTWDINSIGFDGNYVISFQNLNDTLIVNTMYDIVSSTDNGATWNTMLHSDTAIQKSVFINSNVGYATTSYGLSEGSYKKTVDGGQNWNIIRVFPQDDDTLHLNGIFPIDINLVYAYGFKYDQYQKYAVIWKSEDGGETWQTETLPFFLAGEISQMLRYENYVYAVTSQGKIIRLQVEDFNISDNVLINNDFKLYPNPGTDKVYVSSPENISDINIYSLSGKQIKNIKPNKKEISINISVLTQGVYIINCKTESDIKSQLFIKR